MELSEQFEIIRPYNDQEVKGAIERVVQHPHFKFVMNYLYEGGDAEELVQKFKGIETVDQFQSFFSNYTVKRIVEKTSDGLSSQGLENLNPDKSYLFIANHRDIVLDAAIMQILLMDQGHKTSQITFGENLMTQQLMLDLGKLNKMFTFYRGGSRTKQYNNALLYAAYFKHAIQELNESIWIAQRNGRTKDGNDQTQSGLIKMLTVGQKDVSSALSALNIVPVTISYEKEPCDIQKAQEVYISGRGEYVKGPNEDIMSILSGITGNKGRINFAFGTPLNDFIESLAVKVYHTNEFVEKVVEEIDRQVYTDYKLWPSNYIAYDLLHRSDDYRNQYTEKEKQSFYEDMMQKTGALEQLDSVELTRIFLQMYANPVLNSKS